MPQLMQSQFIWSFVKIFDKWSFFCQNLSCLVFRLSLYDYKGKNTIAMQKKMLIETGFKVQNPLPLQPLDFCEMKLKK